MTRFVLPLYFNLCICYNIHTAGDAIDTSQCANSSLSLKSKGTLFVDEKRQRQYCALLPSVCVCVCVCMCMCVHVMKKMLNEVL